MTDTPFSLRTTCRVIGLHEHFRTISGRKDSLGQAVIERINLGWFMHLDLDEGGIAFGLGTERPNLKPGDIIELIFRKLES